MKQKSGFTLVELLLVVGILGVLTTVTVLLVNPVEFLKQSRDATRLSDLRATNDALSLVQVYNPSALGAPDNIIYVSLPSATSPSCDPSLPTPPGGWSYNCETAADYREVNGNGWIPVNFTSVTIGSPLSVLPIDPINTATDGLYYTFVKGSWELNARMESIAYNDGGEKNVAGGDGGNTNLLYEVGTKLTNVPVEVNDRAGTGAALAPTVITSAASLVTSSAATLNGSVNPNGLSTTGWFRYNTVTPGSCNDTFGTRAPTTGGSALGLGMNPVSYSENISGLTAGTTYYFCAIAENSLGKSYGSILQFITTSSTPTVGSITGENPQTTTGGKSITINGTGFVNIPTTSTVTVDGTSATGVTFVSSTQLTATAPAKVAGSYTVVVTNPDSQNGSCLSCMTYTAPPTVSTVSPDNNLNTAGGQTVTVSGSGIKVGTNGVKVDATFATTSGTSSSATFTTPAHAAGAVTLKVYGASGTDSNGIYTDYTPFTYVAAALGRYWVGGTGNWSDTVHWSSSPGGAGGASVPTASDDVYFDASSGIGTATVDVSATTLSLNFIGYTGTFAGSSALNIAGSLMMGSGMTRTYTGAITFSATSIGKTLTFNGKTMASATTFNGVGGGWTLQDAWNNGGSTIVVSSGTLNTNGVTVTCGFFNYSGSGSTKTTTLGASIINVSLGWTQGFSTNINLNAGTSSIRLTSGSSFAGGGLTYFEVQMNGTSTQPITGANTFTNLIRTGTASKSDGLSFSANQTITGTLTLNGNSAINRLLISSSVLGTLRTLTAATVSVTNADFQDITGAGVGNWNLSAITGLSGDAGGNSGIIFTTAATQIANGTTSFSWSNAARWTSRVPLPQDDVVINNAFSASQTVTLDMPRAGKSINWTGATGTPAWAKTTATTMYGSLTMISGMTNSGTTTFTMGGRSLFTWTSATQVFTNPLTIAMFGGTLTLQDDFNTNSVSTISLQAGTLNANNFNITCSGINGNSGLSSITRSVTMGSGTWTLTGTGTVWAFGTGLVTANTSTIKITNNTASAITFGGGGRIYNNVWFSRGASTASNTISGSNTFTDFKDDGSAAHSILFTAGTTQTITTFTVSGTAGNLKTINSTTTGTHALVKSGGGTVSSDYLNIQHSVATLASTWYAGVNSVNNQGVATAGSGWTFTAPPSTYTIQPDGVAGKDTHYGTNYTTGGCPDCTDLDIGGWGDAYLDYLEFNLTGSPSDISTLKAEFWVYGSAPNTPTIEIKRITSAWTEAGVTISSQPTEVAYTTMSTIPSSPAWIVTDITNLYKGWKNGTYTNFGLKMHYANTGLQQNGSVTSSDNATASNRPKLVITYVP